MPQHVVRRLLAAGAVAAVLATGPVQAQGGPQETGAFLRWLGSVQKQAFLVLRLWPVQAIYGEQGLLIDPNGNTAPSPASTTAPSPQPGTDQGHLIDPNG
ncbi:MAG TPA: hypothetical protein VIA62_01435 [Thermoanaerobaculia bacterium]|jgi:hypothetical protein|nr:hypothetical protein [Thermoanaerobaculia bacterium]